jgi:hypothetical protein
MISHLMGGYAKYEQVIWNVNIYRENNRACTYFLNVYLDVVHLYV